MPLGLLRRNSFETVGNGVTISAANSGGAADDAFDLVLITGTATATGDTTAGVALDGSRALRVQVATVADTVFCDYTGQNDSAGAGRVAFKLNALPGSGVVVNIAGLVDIAAATICRVQISSNKLVLTVGAVTVKTFATTLVTSQWYRVGFRIVPGTTSANGTAECAYYLGNSTTPAETAYLASNLNAGTLNIGEARFGKITGSGTFDGWLDEPAYLPGGTALIGPPGPITVPPAAAAAAGALLLPSVHGQVSVAGTGNATAVGQMLAPTVSGVSAPGFTATVEAGNVPPRVRLDIANAGGPSVYVTRTGPDGIAVPVRGGNPLSTIAGQMVLYDVEAPFNQPVTYQAGSVLAPSVTVPATQPWLIHPGIPSLSRPVIVKILGDETSDSPAGVHDIVGRGHPIIVTDGRRKGQKFQMLLKTLTAAERVYLDQLFYDTSPLLLQVTYPFTGEFDYRWISVGRITTARLSATRYTDPARVWTCECTDVDAPVGGVQAQRTWADLMAECVTWADVRVKYRTWRGVLTGLTGT